LGSRGNGDILDSEFSIPGFKLFRADQNNGHRGGGVLLLVRDDLGAVEVTLRSTFSDQVWCKIKIKNGEDLCIGICYRSPNPDFCDRDNDMKLCDMLAEMRGRPTLLMGDFNFPDIDWSSSEGHTPVSRNFIDCIEDGFLTQHVAEGTCNGTTLDLVITSEPEMIDTVSVLSKLGNSDHNMLQWEVQPSPVSSLFNRHCLNYAQANFAAIHKALRETNWSQILHGDANDDWRTFHSLLKSLEA